MNQILEQLADQRDAAVKKVTELESRIRSLERDNVSLQQWVYEVSGDTEALDKNNYVRAAYNPDNKPESSCVVPRYRERIRDLECSLTDRIQQVSDFTTEKCNLEEMYQDSQQTIKSQREHIVQLEQRIVEVGAEFINQSYKLIDSEKENATLKQEIACMDTQLSALRDWDINKVW